MSFISKLKKDSDVVDTREIKAELEKLETVKLEKTKAQLKKERDAEVSSFYAMAYRLLSKRVAFLFPRLVNLEPALKKGGMPVHYEAYICGMVFASLVGAIIGLVAGIGIGVAIRADSTLAFMLPLILVLALSQGIMGFMMKYPALNMKSRGSKILTELPYFIGYMATLAASGLGLESIFKAIAKEDSKEIIVSDAKIVSRNLEVLGMDIISAVKELIERTPDGPYNEMLEGVISTIESGGNLQEYFGATAKVQMEEKKLMLKKMTEGLGMVAEMYTILMIVFPLLAVIMLSIMAIMMPSLAGFDLITLMKLLTFGMVPIFGMVMLVMMDSMVPKR